MINNQFLLYQTVQAYQADVLNNNIKPSSIAFVVEDGTVRTHGFKFGGKYVESDNLLDYIRKDELQDYSPTPEEQGIHLSEYVRKSEIGQYIPEIPESGDNKKHVFLTQAQYDDLGEYERNTIYFIVESAIDEATDYQFGGRFPLIFGGPQTNNTEQSEESDNT